MMHHSNEKLVISGICALKNVIEPLSISRTLVLRCFLLFLCSGFVKQKIYILILIN